MRDGLIILELRVCEERCRSERPARTSRKMCWAGSTTWP